MSNKQAEKNIYILYHKNCTDGFGAAFAAWLKFKNKAHYIAVNYGEPIPEMVDGSIVYIIDFCYDKDTTEMMNQKYDLTILDHHKSAKQNVMLAKNYCFDLKKSGASLAWEFFHPKKKNPLIKHIEDKDLWLFKNKNTKPIIAALEAYPRNFKVWKKLTLPQLKREGLMILQKQNSEVDFISTFHYLLDFPDYPQIPVVNSASFMSDVAEKLLQMYPDKPFVGVYHEYERNGIRMRKWSLRSRKQGEDVSKVAGQFNGGGHYTSSGFIEKAYESVLIKVLDKTKQKNELITG